MIVEEDAVANSCLKSKDLRRRVIIYSPEEENGHINCLSARWILEVQYIALEEMAGENGVPQSLTFENMARSRRTYR